MTIRLERIHLRLEVRSKALSKIALLSVGAIITTASVWVCSQSEFDERPVAYGAYFPVSRPRMEKL